MRKKNDLISIVVPVYNAEKYLSRCIDTIINQTYKKLEVILVNDGSTDNSKKICEEYASRDNRIKVINKKNGGVSAARNDAINMATGKYIGFVDSDDYIELDMFEKMHDMYIMNKDTDLIVCNIFDSKNKESNITKYNSFDFSPMLFDNNGPAGYLWNKLYKLDIIKSNKILLDKSVHICEDLLFNFNYIKHIKNIVYLEEGLYHYIINESSASNQTTVNDRKVTAIEAYIKIKDYIDEKNIVLRDIYLFNLLNTGLRLRMEMIISNKNYNNINAKITELIKKYKNMVFLSKYVSLIKKIKLAIYIYNIRSIVFYNKIKRKIH